VKTFNIERQSKRNERMDSLVPWIVVPVFALGFLAGDIWPAHQLSLHLGFYALGFVVAARLILILARISRAPVNYRSLRLSDSGLEYQGLTSERLTVPWPDIESIVFYRDEALFPDLTGPYLETMWIVKNQDGRVIEVMDERGNRARLLAAFRKCLPGFDFVEARRGLRSRKAGRWTCFQKPRAASLPEGQPGVLARP
jgi:hypothetical protein